MTGSAQSLSVRDSDRRRLAQSIAQGAQLFWMLSRPFSDHNAITGFVQRNQHMRSHIAPVMAGPNECHPIFGQNRGKARPPRPEDTASVPG